MNEALKNLDHDFIIINERNMVCAYKVKGMDKVFVDHPEEAVMYLMQQIAILKQQVREPWWKRLWRAFKDA